jgi:methionine aminotransferase
MSKLPILVHIFTVMSRWQTNTVLSISPRIPNFPVDERLTNIVARLAKKEHQYLPMAGYPPLLSKIALLVQSSYGRTPNPETEILVTAGAHKPFCHNTSLS